jgi:hypothetical protein
MIPMGDWRNTVDKGEGNISVDICNKFLLYRKNRRRSVQGADRCSCGGRLEELLIAFVQHGKILWDLSKPQAIRGYVLEQLPDFDL